MTNISAPVFSREAVLDVCQIMKQCPWTEDLMNELLNLWELCTRDDERTLLKELINEIFILDTPKARDACNGISTYLNSLKIDPKHAFIVAVADVGKNDGSSAGLKLLELKVTPTEEWESRYISHIPNLAEKVVDGDTIIIFDDFIGSGNKIIKKINWLADELIKNDHHIDKFDLEVVSFSAMKFGLDNIKTNLGITPFTHNSFSKAISEKNSIKDSISKINIMRKIESRLEQNYKNRDLSKYTLGYNKSEALYYWDGYSCPNNVFPIFWWPKLKGRIAHKTLLTRTN